MGRQPKGMDGSAVVKDSVQGKKDRNAEQQSTDLAWCPSGPTD